MPNKKNNLCWVCEVNEGKPENAGMCDECLEEGMRRLVRELKNE